MQVPAEITAILQLTSTCAPPREQVQYLTKLNMQLLYLRFISSAKSYGCGNRKKYLSQLQEYEQHEVTTLPFNCRKQNLDLYSDIYIACTLIL